MHVASIEHKADITDAAEPWSDVSFSGVNTTTLAGVDHFSGISASAGSRLRPAASVRNSTVVSAAIRA